MIRIIRALTIVLMLWPLASAAKMPTPAQQRLLASLGQEMIDKLQASGKFASVRHSDTKTLVARTHDGAEASVNLDNIASSVDVRPSERPKLVDQLLQAVLSSIEPNRPAKSKADFADQLRIVIRHTSYLTAPKSAKRQAPLTRQIAGDAVAFVAQTHGEEISFVMSGGGEQYGLTDEAVYDLALQQMQRYVMDHSSEQDGQVRVFLANDESYSPSLLLLPEIWNKVERDFGQDFLVAIPDRTILLAAPLRNASGLARTVAALMNQRKATPHISHFIQRADGGWKRFK